MQCMYASRSTRRPAGVYQRLRARGAKHVPRAGARQYLLAAAGCPRKRPSKVRRPPALTQVPCRNTDPPPPLHRAFPAGAGGARVPGQRVSSASGLGGALPRPQVPGTARQVAWH